MSTYNIIYSDSYIGSNVSILYIFDVNDSPRRHNHVRLRYMKVSLRWQILEFTANVFFLNTPGTMLMIYLFYLEG